VRQPGPRPLPRGRKPVGWRIEADGVLVKDPDEQPATSRILEMRAGGASLRAIADAV